MWSTWPRNWSTFRSLADSMISVSLSARVAEAGAIAVGAGSPECRVLGKEEEKADAWVAVLVAEVDGRR